ncbi:MAG: F0F1 ATP synthase subunit delta [Patescibacteria group bacterium]
MANISNKEIAEAIWKGSQDKKGHEFNIYIKNVVAFLNKKRLLGKSAEILTELKKLINKSEGIVEARVRVASKLGTHLKYDLSHAIKKRYHAREVALEEVLDESLLGGVRIEAEGEVIDLTTRNKINQLQEYLIQKA